MIRFQHGGAYQAAIRDVRRSVRRNGTRAVCADVPIVHSSAPDTRVHFYVNMAYQPNNLFPKADASLYTIAFSNGAGRVFRFGGEALSGIAAPFAQSTRLREDGSYRSLDCAQGPFPDITSSGLEMAVRRVASHNGDYLDSSMKKALVCLIIAVNEAVRFTEVEGGSSVLVPSAKVYAPSWNLIHNWGAHSLPG